MLYRYTTDRVSSFVHADSTKSNPELTRLAYHSSRKATLAPLALPQAPACECELVKFDPGVPNFIWAQDYTPLHDHVDMVLPAAPNLTKDHTEESFNAMAQAIEICKLITVICNPCVDREAKDQKKKLLQKMKRILTPDFMKAMPASLGESLVDMFEKNAFRTVPEIHPRFLVGDSEPSVMDRAWAQLGPVYDLFLGYFGVSARNPRFDLAFEQKMMTLLYAPDGNERDLVAAFFVNYAGAHPDRELVLWTKFTHLLGLYRQNAIPPFVVDPILQFFTARFPRARCDRNDVIKNRIFRYSIMPLISAQHFLSWTDRLLTLLDILGEEQPELVADFVQEVLLRWPHARSSTFIPWITWTNELVERLPHKHMQRMMRPLFTLYAEFADNPSHRIVEASFKIWGSQATAPKLADHSSIIYPILYPVLLKGSTSSNKRIQTSCLSMLKTLEHSSPTVFGKLKNKYKNPKVVIVDEVLAKASKWATIAKSAWASYRGFALQQVISGTCQYFGVAETDINQATALVSR
jgi:serine/threonine-protein phosphatase 2A regulatory subunit B'